jgi:hypothetical protein
LVSKCEANEATPVVDKRTDKRVDGRKAVL